ncbi:tRNA (mo5U34)-methyltransferase [Anaerohalosphaera lusitana]|uniref:tRNA (Mo5U34)-methyltransferase n=1 Tax=Anaerohalosphaera lusitana TaxID=1936003 RepID=A0A1U9NP91_9BACT|nr:tRNA 5-methoxyuridine(34)/uridine 5-oxyacetic acid(34) synthase CmoB [Anaerohalosphaera lusitana]AQT69733.1 tRNA (mo5U34)-methyltransferase [Anaerohalosphaera lusitana]
MTDMLSYFDNFFDHLRTVDAELSDRLRSITADICENISHGDLDRWLGAVESMPNITPSTIDLGSNALRIGKHDDCDDTDLDILRQNLMTLHPWRKGPFSVFGIDIETEWRSDLKWDRVKDAIEPLEGKLVLDVGSGNGYFGFRMIDAGARAVVSIDPFLLFVIQFLALNRFAKCERTAVLPLGIEDVPTDKPSYDAVFSMGVLYHRRDPIAHLRELHNLTLPGGEVILETLVIDEPGEAILEPKGRYAKMRNVWAIPSPRLAAEWMTQAGLHDVRIIDVTRTTAEEQRPTEWMAFESLPNYLDPNDSSKTIEGYPAPARGVLIGRKR